MRQMDYARNKNMAYDVNPSWINVPDKIIMEWFNKFTHDSFVSVENHILLKMSTIQSSVGLPQFCVCHRLLREMIDWHS